MVNWKAADANDRLMGALLAAHPELKLNYSKIATVFGQGATYNAVEGQFRKFRKMAEQLASGAPDNDNSAAATATAARPKTTTPRAPRTPRSSQTNGITKSGGGSGKRGASAKKSNGQKSPTKAGKEAKKALLNAITLSETDSDGDSKSVKSETTVAVGEGGVKPEDEKVGFGPVPPVVDSQANGYVVQAEDDDDVFGEDA